MGGSGGGSAGEVAFPAHMGTPHADWLDNTGADTMANSVVDLMNTAQAGVSPFAGWVTVDPAIIMGAAAQVLTPFQAVEDLDALNLQTIFDTFFAVIDDAVPRAAIVTAEAAVLEAILVADILPPYQYGMRDVGSVLTTGFTIGEANLRAVNVRAIAKLDAELALQSRRAGWQMSMQWVQINIDWNRLVAALADEVAIRYMEARMKADQLDTEMGAKDTLFDLETYQYGSNVMASISGAVVRGQGGSSGGVGAALGGVLSGAATGAAIGSVVPVLGTTAGAAIGAALGLGSAIF